MLFPNFFLPIFGVPWPLNFGYAQKWSVKMLQRNIDEKFKLLGLGTSNMAKNNTHGFLFKIEVVSQNSPSRIWGSPDLLKVQYILCYPGE